MTIKKLASKVEEGLKESLPKLRKTVVGKLSLVVAAVLEAQTANTAAIANLVPLETESSHHRQQWLRRLLKNGLVDCIEIMKPFASVWLAQAARGGQVVLLSMDQTDIGNRFGVLMISVRVGERALPIAWCVEEGAANIGFAGQEKLLERVLGWLPAGAQVMLLADRFYPSNSLLRWLGHHQWQYRLRLKGNLSLDIGEARVATTGEFAHGRQERYVNEARLFEEGVPTAIGMLHEPGHPEPWIIAMDCVPTQAAVRDYGSRWSIEPMFSDFKTRGFGLEDTHLKKPERLERLILIMALAMAWCVQVGRFDAQHHPTSTEKKHSSTPIPATGASGKQRAACSPGSNADCVCS